MCQQCYIGRQEYVMNVDNEKERLFCQECRMQGKSALLSHPVLPFYVADTVHPQRTYYESRETAQKEIEKLEGSTTVIKKVYLIVIGDEVIPLPMAQLGVLVLEEKK
jgi:hypothetical protein